MKHRNPTVTVAEIIDRSQCLLLDFDGPVCSVFAGYSAPAVAAQLEGLLVEAAADRIHTGDPFEVLRYAATLGNPKLLYSVEEALRDAELVAVNSAVPTPGAREVVDTTRRSGRQVAIVSNNSAPAILAYLQKGGLAQHVYPVVGRPFAHPDQMKPSATPVLTAAKTLGVHPGQCVLVGDSVADIDAAHAAGCTAIGYANKPGKRDRLSQAEAVVGSMSELAEVLRSHPMTPSIGAGSSKGCHGR